METNRGASEITLRDGCDWSRPHWKGHRPGGAPAREVTSILFAARDTAPSSLSGLTCLVPTAKEMQISIVQLTAYHGCFACTCRSLGSWATSHPPPKDSINCTLLVICCTRSTITVC